MPFPTLLSREPWDITLYGYRKLAKKSSKRWYTCQMRLNLKASGFRSGRRLSISVSSVNEKSSSRFLLPSFLCLPGTGGLGFGVRDVVDRLMRLPCFHFLTRLEVYTGACSPPRGARLQLFFLFQSAVFQVCQSIRASGKQCWNSTGRTPLKLSESFV